MTLLLHGFTGAPASWDAVRARGIEGHALALPGHGAPVDVEAGFSGGVRYVAEAIARAGAPQDLAGYSLGARLALGVAVERPELVRRLTLVGVNFGIDDAERPARRAWEAGIARLLREEGLEAFLAEWSKLPLFATQGRLDPSTTAAQARIRERHDPGALADALEAFALSGMPDYRPALSRLPMPVHLVVGGEDEKFRRLAEAALPALRDGRCTLVDDTGHNVVLERPDVVADALR